MSVHTRGTISAWFSFLLGVTLTLLIAVGDWSSGASRWLGTHPYTKEAVAGLIGLVVTVWLIASWLGWRESRRLSRVAVIAYRSLAQAVNDNGRRVLAPINGADLWFLGIPGAQRGDVEAARQWLSERDLPIFDERSGQWPSRDVGLRRTLASALSDTEKRRELFRVVSAARRGMQAATALWAPTLLAVKGPATSVLSNVQEFTDLLELLQENLRRAGLTDPTSVSDATTGSVTDVETLYWYTIHVYERERDALKELGRLPSDDPKVSEQYLALARSWAADQSAPRL